MNCLILGLIESIYIIYILCYFKTKTNFAHPFSYINNPFFYHPIGKIDNEKNLICPVGHMMAYIGAIFIISRCLFSPSATQLYFKKYHFKIIVVSILFSLINFNAFIYLLPVFIYEFYYLHL